MTLTFISKSNIIKKHVISLILLLFFFVKARACNVFIGNSKNEYFLEIHRRVKDDLEFYIHEEEKRLSNIKSYANLYKREHEKAMEDIPNYIGNPINAYTVIKRLSTDLEYLKHSIKLGAERAKNVPMTYQDATYPSHENLTRAVQALARLQKTYNLDITEELADKVNSVTYSTTMSASDCYVLGRALYVNSDFENARTWLIEAFRKYNSMGNSNYPFTDVHIMNYISFVYYMLGDLQAALQWTKKILDVNPRHSGARGSLLYYENLITEQEFMLSTA